MTNPRKSPLLWAIQKVPKTVTEVTVSPYSYSWFQSTMALLTSPYLLASTLQLWNHHEKSDSPRGWLASLVRGTRIARSNFGPRVPGRRRHPKDISEHEQPAFGQSFKFLITYTIRSKISHDYSLASTLKILTGGFWVNLNFANKSGQSNDTLGANPNL